jgi:hypothetical protein
MVVFVSWKSSVGRRLGSRANTGVELPIRGCSIGERRLLFGKRTAILDAPGGHIE